MPLHADIPASSEPPICKGEALIIDFTVATTDDITNWTLRFQARDRNAILVIDKAMSVQNASTKTIRLSLTHDDNNIPADTYSFSIFRTDSGFETCLRYGSYTLTPTKAQFI